MERKRNKVVLNKIECKFVVCLLMIFLAVPLVDGAHYIIGIVNDAKDGTLANDRIVLLWNSDNGMDDNLTDIVGPNGNSGTDNIYMIDCELLNNGCSVGDELSVKVINESNQYITYVVNVSVGGGGYDIAPNLTLNSPPNSTLNFPQDNSNFSLVSIDFNCSFSDLDSNMDNISLYGNWSAGWHSNETIDVNGNGSVVFSKNLLEGMYEWNCLATDDLNAQKFGESNFTITVDGTPPNISFVYVNESYVCGSNYVRVNCTVVEERLELDSVIIRAISPSGSSDYPASLLAGDTYYVDILADEIGEWGFICIANDSVNNTANLSSGEFWVYSTSPDLVVYSSEINFSNYDPIENVVVVIEALVNNSGCGVANNFLVGFYDGDPDSDGWQINGNKTVSISGLSDVLVNVTWSAEIGPLNLFVFADVSEIINEANESNNKANRSIDVGAWQEFYGNVSADKVLSDSSFSNVSLWANQSVLGGNIFIVDMESDVDWSSLQAIGRNITNGSVTNDFSEIDSLLNMTSFDDSVSALFSEGGSPKFNDSFFINYRTIENVPITNSTDNSIFFTGILWDSSDDGGDGEFSQSDKEDLVFVTKINDSLQGDYGIYDYEIKAPARLREYNSTDQIEVYLYYDLV